MAQLLRLVAGERRLLGRPAVARVAALHAPGRGPRGSALVAFFGLFVFPLALFCFGGQPLYFHVFHAYMARDTVRLGIALRGTLGAWLAAWGALGRCSWRSSGSPRRSSSPGSRASPRRRRGARGRIVPVLGLRRRGVLLLGRLRRVALAAGRAARHLLHPRRRARAARRRDAQGLGAAGHLAARAGAAARRSPPPAAPPERAAHRHRERARRRDLLGAAAPVQGAVPRRGRDRPRPARAAHVAVAGHALVVRDALDGPGPGRRLRDDAARPGAVGGGARASATAPRTSRRRTCATKTSPRSSGAPASTCMASAAELGGAGDPHLGAPDENATARMLEFVRGDAARDARARRTSRPCTSRTRTGRTASIRRCSRSSRTTRRRGRTRRSCTTTTATAC